MPLRPRSTLRSRQQVRADSGKGGERPSGDWDEAWRNLRQDLKKGLPEVDARPGSGGPTPPPRMGPRPRPRQIDDNYSRIRRQEDRVLDAWSKPTFFAAGGAIALLILLGVLLSNAPSDSRCTLPWC